MFPTRLDTIISKDTRCLNFGDGAVVLRSIIRIMPYSHKKVQKIPKCHFSCGIALEEDVSQYIH